MLEQWYHIDNRQDLYNLGITDPAELMHINNQHGYKMCKGKVYINKDGYARIARCNRWHCWLCGDHRTELVRQSILLMTTSNICPYSITWKFTDGIKYPNVWHPPWLWHYDFNFQRLYIEQFRAWIRTASERIRKRGETLSYIAVHSVGKKLGKLHTHLVTSHELDGDNVEYCELIKTPEGKSEYMRKNLEYGINYDYYPHWRYTAMSRDAPKARTTDAVTPHMVDVTHNITNAKITINRLLVSDAVAIGWQARKCSRCRHIIESGNDGTRCALCRLHDKQRHHNEAIIKHIL